MSRILSRMTGSFELPVLKSTKPGTDPNNPQYDRLYDNTFDIQYLINNETKNILVNRSDKEFEKISSIFWPVANLRGIHSTSINEELLEIIYRNLGEVKISLLELAVTPFVNFLKENGVLAQEESLRIIAQEHIDHLENTLRTFLSNYYSYSEQ